MPESNCDILIVGGGTGGCAAALAACSMGLKVILTEETDWIGGQLTAQMVPPDEHPWIEQFGCTARYREYRDRVRKHYRQHFPLTDAARNNRYLNPGGGWVSRLCHDPRVGLKVLGDMLAPFVASGLLEIRLRTAPLDAELDGESISIDPLNPRARQESSADRIRAIRLLDLDDGGEEVVRAKIFLDATELGELLPMTGTGYAIGAEPKKDTGEPSAVHGPAEWDDVQGITWCMAIAHDDGSHRVIDKPKDYARWRAFKPDFWPGPLLGFDVLHAHTGKPVVLPLLSDHWYALFPYRQIVDPRKLTQPVDPVTVVNWPQNDYFTETILDIEAKRDLSTGVPLASGPLMAERLEDAKELSRCLLYWLQTEAPRHDGSGTGYPGLYLAPEFAGTSDGFAKTAYIREGRRMLAEFTVREQDIAAASNPGLIAAPSFKDSVGVGAYRIDLHPSTNGKNTIDSSTLPFEIPLGSLIPQRMQNLIPAAKNLGVTHIANGCYRLHPVEWNIGESAGFLAADAILSGLSPREIYEDAGRLQVFQELLINEGVELRWPQLRPL